MSNQSKALVSVIMPVYNHEKYVAQAIESVLMQKTDFKYELIIGEDCSTDGSRNIIREYQSRYPNIIKVIYQSENRGMFKNGSMIRKRAKGKYWAFCEGDDYWTDSSKLQKQVDFLENNNRYSAVYHNVLCVDKKGRPCKRKSINKYPLKTEGIYTFDMIKGMNLVGQTASLVCRNIYEALGKKEYIQLYENCKCNGDQRICAIAACLGDIYFLQDIMAEHRVVLEEGSSWSAMTYNKNRLLEMYNSYMALCVMLNKIFERDYRSRSYEEGLCAESIRKIKEKPTFSNFAIYLQLLILYSINRAKDKWGIAI